MRGCCNWVATAASDPRRVASVSEVPGGGLPEPRVEQSPNFRVLGPLTAEVNGNRVALGGPKERTVLAVLVAADGQPVTVDALTDALWDDFPPPSSERTLHAYVARLRKSLGASVIVTHGRGYALAVSRTGIDASRFVAAAAVGRAARERGDPGGAVTAFDQALAEWGGAAFLGHDDVESCVAAARRLDEERRTVVEERFEAMLDLGHSADLVADLRAAVGAEPYRERLWASLMIAQYRAGRRADALRAYQEARVQLVEGIGVEPGPRLRELEAAILTDDVSVLGAAAAWPLLAVPALLDSGGSAFVSRDLELGRVRDAWARVSRGIGQVMSITGPEGAGKTRLVAEVAREVHNSGGVVLFARSDASHRTGRSVLDQALRSAGGSLLAAQAAAPPGESLGAAVARLLVSWSERQPILLALDDLHEAEADVLALVSDVATGVANAAVLVMPVFRGESHDGVSAANQVALRGLSRDGVAAVCQVYGDDWTDVEIDAVWTATSGWPLAVHESAAQRTRRASEQRARLAADAARSAEQRLVVSQEALIDEVVGMRRSARTRGREFRTREPSRPVGDPFRGLAPFEREHGPWFFGRDAAVGEVIAELAAHPAVAVVGASGSGKSSLIRAGVLPALADGALAGSDAWDVVVLTPGTDPAAAVRGALDGASARRRLLVVDQFEELFAAGNSSARDVFAELLFDHIAGGNLLIAIVRADQVAHLAELSAIDTLLGGHTVLVAPMREAGLREAIERPLDVAGFRAEEGLVDTILADARGSREVLPLLQTALLATCERRTGDLLTIVGYRASGGVAGAIARLAEEMYAGLTPAASAAARRMFVRLVDVDRGGAFDLRRRVARHELVGAEDEPGEAAAAEALAAAVSHRLVVLDAGTVEITHEALVREWPRLARWIDDDRDGHRLHQRLGDSARAWLAADRDPSELLRGARLEAVDEWSAGHADYLNDAERELLDASRSAKIVELAESEHRASEQSRSNARLRHRLVVATVLLVLALGAMSAAAWQWQRQRASADNARHAQLTSDARRLSAEALIDERIDHALLTAVAGVQLDDRPDTQAGLVTALQRAPLATMIRRLPNGARPQRILVSPDGATLVVADNAGLVHVLNASTLDQMTVLDGGWGLHFVDDGRLVVAATDSGDLRIVDPLQAGSELRLTGGSIGASFVDSDPAGATVIAEGADGVVAWDTSRPDEPILTHVYVDRVAGVALVDSGRSAVVVGSGAEPAEVVDLSSGEVTAHFNGANALAVSSDRQFFATAAVDDDRTVLLYAVGSTKPIHSLSVPAAVTALAISSDGRLVAVGMSNGTELYRTDGTFLLRLDGQAERARGLDFAPDGKSLFGVSLDGTIMRWDVSGASAGFAWQTLTDGLLRPKDNFGPMFISPLGDVAIPVDAGILVLAGAESGARLRLQTDHSLPELPEAIFAVAWAPDGAALATGGGDAKVRLWDTRTGSQLGEWQAPLGRMVGSATFDRTGTRLVVGLTKGPLPKNANPSDILPEDAYAGPDVFVLEAKTLEPLVSYEVPELQSGAYQSGVYGLWLDPSGTQLLVACCELYDKHLTLIDLADGRESWTAAGAMSAAFSADGELLAVGSGDGALSVLRTEDGTTVAGPVNAHDGWAETVAFSPDGTTLVTGGTDGLTRLWRTDDLAPAGTFDVGAGREGDAVLSVFALDGTRVLIYDGHKLWNVPAEPKQMIAQACATAGRDLTPDEWSELVPDQPYRTTCP